MTTLRRLGLDDMEAAARVHRAAFDARLPWLAGLHTPDEDRAFYRERVFRKFAVWGAERDGALVGVIAFGAGWVDQLYILPAWHRRGIGTTLLTEARREADALRLYTFQRNVGARAFYAAHGFVAIAETDGAGNEEREPDVLYEWVRRPG